MVRKRFHPAPYWPEDRLRHDQELAVARFITDRGNEGTKQYEATFRAAEPLVRRLFRESDDLRAFSGGVLERHPELVHASRYLGGPPVSADDLRTLAGGHVSAGRLRGEFARKVAGVVQAAWDPIRFPWLQDGRAPRSHEREAAINWTAGLWAVEQLRTRRRSASSREQERRVADVLTAAGWNELRHDEVGPIRVIDDLRRGTFTRERLLAEEKCDLPVRLSDGRLLALECKVSNSAVNSYKRLNREIGDKAAKWNRAFGDQVVTGAVLAGVYKLANLSAAQDNSGIAIFWDHDLGALRDFVSAART